MPIYTKRQFNRKFNIQVNLGGGGGGGGGNNIAIVGTPGGKIANNAVTPPQIDSDSLSVTAGNTLLIGIVQALDGWTPAAGDLTKIAGTATIGTITLDQSYPNPSSNERGVAIYRVPITGSGSLTVSCTNAGRAGNFWLMGWAEFSGFNATPLSTTSTATGSGATASSGSISTPNVGVIFYVSGDLSGSDFSRTYSDTLVYKNDTASNDMTGIVQYKIINSSPNTMTDTVNTAAWYIAYAAYKSS